MSIWQHLYRISKLKVGQPTLKIVCVNQSHHDYLSHMAMPVTGADYTGVLPYIMYARNTCMYSIHWRHLHLTLALFGTL